MDLISTPMLLLALAGWSAVAGLSEITIRPNFQNPSVSTLRARRSNLYHNSRFEQRMSRLCQAVALPANRSMFLGQSLSQKQQKQRLTMAHNSRQQSGISSTTHTVGSARLSRAWVRGCKQPVRRLAVRCRRLSHGLERVLRRSKADLHPRQGSSW